MQRGYAIPQGLTPIFDQALTPPCVECDQVDRDSDICLWCQARERYLAHVDRRPEEDLAQLRRRLEREVKVARDMGQKQNHSGQRGSKTHRIEMSDGQVYMALDMRSRGYSYRAIADQLGLSKTFVNIWFRERQEDGLCKD